ncbi:MAG: RND transporter, partial [Cyclobacteriaceae bacterium]|nr:RND transporter [Cyclobacteriaceae bacterium]
VIKVANVGEQRPNADAKVFEVEIEVFGSDDLLKPAMTTSNRIITKTMDDVFYLPLECLHSQSDSITFVYKKDGMKTIKQEVMIGDANTNDVVILAGLDAGERVYLSNVADMEEEPINLLTEMEGKRNPPKEEQVPKENEEPNVRRRMPSGMH